MKKTFLFIILPILVLGCTNKRYEPQIVQTQSQGLEKFKAIHVAGSSKVELVNGPYSLTTSGLEKKLNNIAIKVKDNNLQITSSPEITVQIAVPDLKTLLVSGNATVFTTNFTATDLTIIAKNNSSLNLAGQLRISKILQQGNGRIDIGWISSNNLQIESAANGPIHLAGVANKVFAKLTHSAQLDCRYLRAEDLSIFTTDNATAHVFALKSLEAFAVNKSNIFYYKRPKHLTVVTKNSGNVLKLDWIR